MVVDGCPFHNGVLLHAPNIIDGAPIKRVLKLKDCPIHKWSKYFFSIFFFKNVLQINLKLMTQTRIKPSSFVLLAQHSNQLN